jgi:hypothetical protein
VAGIAIRSAQLASPVLIIDYLQGKVNRGNFKKTNILNAGKKPLI